MDWVLLWKLVLRHLAVLLTWQREDMGVDGGHRSQDTQARTLGGGRDTALGHCTTLGGGRDTCGLLQGHTGWLPECHTHILPLEWNWRTRISSATTVVCYRYYQFRWFFEAKTVKAYFQKTRVSGDKNSANFLDFPPNFRLRMNFLGHF